MDCPNTNEFCKILIMLIIQNSLQKIGCKSKEKRDARRISDQGIIYLCLETVTSITLSHGKDTRNHHPG